MKELNKLCDAADWFDPEMQRVIIEELHETPRFHRKQWEFAAIFRALQQHGLLDGESLGLSMGGGKELLLYAIARHVKQLVVTDLYDTVTTWDCARTDDPDAFIKTDMPLEVDVSRLKALRMDMRELAFEDSTFDFCYSSCSIEHIGERKDFLRHLNEAHRVLKVGGVYVFTTEVHYGPETIMDPNNYVFSLEYLVGLFEETGFDVPQEFDAGIAHHKVNFPLPANIRNLSYIEGNHISTPVFRELPHVQLLRGTFPFTSGQFILKKGQSKTRIAPMQVVGMDRSRGLLKSGIDEYRGILQNNLISLNPLSSVPVSVSRFFTDHAEFLGAPVERTSDDPTIFHTDYFWFGSGTRTFTIRLDAAFVGKQEPCSVKLRIHRYQTLASTRVDCAREMIVVLTSPGTVVRELAVPVDDDFCYAVLGHLVQGACKFERIEISSRRVKENGRPEQRINEPKSSETFEELQWTLLPDASPGFML